MNRESFLRLIEIGATIPDESLREEHNQLVKTAAEAQGLNVDDAQEEKKDSSSSSSSSSEEVKEEPEPEPQPEPEPEPQPEPEPEPQPEPEPEPVQEETKKSSSSSSSSSEEEAREEQHQEEEGGEELEQKAKEAFDREKESAASRITPPTARTADITDPEILNTYCKIRSDYHQTNWCWVGYNGTDNKLSVYGSGSGGFDEFFDFFKTKKDEPMYGYLRYIFGDTDRAKFIMYTYVPDSLGGLRKMKVQNHKGTVTTFYKYFHIEISAFSQEELSEKRLVLKLKASGGADYGTGKGGGTRGEQNFGGIKNQARNFYGTTETQGTLKSIVFEKGPLSTTPIDLKGRPMVASATEARKNTNHVGNLDSTKIKVQERK